MSRHDIFISYKREDADTAQWFAEGLEREGFSVWWDVSLRSGDAYDEAIEIALKAASAVIVLWSPRSVHSRWVRAEATAADRLNTLVPVIIEPCELPIMFELVKTAQLDHWDGSQEDEKWQALIAEVREKISRQRLTEPPELIGFALSQSDESGNTKNVRGAAPSLAILPFTNRSRLEEDEIFAEGMVEDIVTALSQGSGVRTLASVTTAHLKGSALTNLSAVARQLDVRYFLEGNVRRTGTDFRVTTQLFEAQNGHVLWTGSFDRPLAELADLQEELATEVAVALGAKVTAFDVEQALKKPNDLTAWEAVQRSMVATRRVDPSSIDLAVEEARRATDIDPSFALSHAALARALAVRYFFYESDSSETVSQIRRIIDRSIALDDQGASLLTAVANAYCMIDAPTDGYARAKQASERAPNYGLAHYILAMASSMLNRFDEAIYHADVATALMPGGFAVYFVKAWHAIALVRQGKWSEAEAIFDECLAMAPDFVLGLYHKAIICWRDGREEEANSIVTALRENGIDYASARRVLVRTYVNSPTIEEMMSAADGVWKETTPNSGA